MPHPTTFFVRPKKGLRMADPKTGDYLPESGMLMPRSGFWLRRLKDGDVIEVKTVNPEPASAPSQEAGKSVKGKKE